MAYVEVWKSGRLITRRRVDEQKAQKGCRVRLGSAGEVRVAIGQSETLGELEVRMFAGEPPPAWQEVKKTVSRPPQDDQSLPPLSVETPGLRAEQMDRYPDIEGYKIIEPLGEGGMGIVWRAEQLSTRRQVALKLMVSHRIESPKAQARFQREVELTARLDHPNIARIYDSGLHQGMYYYAMELIDGVPLDQYVKSKSLSRTQILALMQKVCQAVLYAHLRAVIHRDLKPSNILVSPDGQPHVLDFGLAKALLEEDDALTISVEGQIAGTPAYMSPEQAAGHHSQTDTRTDVFSLGVILYELLTGQSPHDLSGSTFDVLHQITEGRIRRPHEITKTIDCELEALLLKALALEPDDRYASAGALAKDISNYLNGEPLDAQVPTILYFLRKKALKYRVQVAIGLAVSFVLLGTMLVAYTKIVTERAISESKDWEIKLKSAQLTWRELELKALSENEQEAHAALRIIRDEYVSAQDEISQLNHKLGERKPPVVVRRVDLQPGAALASTTLVRKPSLPGGVKSWTLETYGHRGRITKLVYSPDGSRLASASSDGATIARANHSRKIVEILDSQSGDVLRVLSANADSIASVSWSPDGTLVAVGTTDGAVHLWDVGSGSNNPLASLPAHSGAVNALAWKQEGQNLITAGEDGKIKIWEPRTGKLIGNLERHTGPIICLAPSPNGKALASGSHDGTIRLWELDAGRMLNVWRKEPNGAEDGQSAFAAIAWSPDGTLLASGDSLGKIQIWNQNSRQPIHSFAANCQSISSLAWSPDGRVLLCGGTDGTARIWDAKNDFQEHIVLLPLWGPAGPGIAVSSAGDYRGPPGIADHLVYVVETTDGQMTLSPADFKSQYGWINEPWQVGLYAPGLEKVDRIYVKADAQGPYKGTSWNDAFDDLQDALNVAQPNTEIWVATGVYTPDRGTGAREASFRLKNGVRLYGGFSGTETRVYERDPEKNETILSGDLKGDDGPGFANNDENSYHVVNSSRTDETALLDGFIITAGNTNGPREYRPYKGGGIYNRGSSLVLTTCIFVDNLADNGGGMVNATNSSPILTNCRFVGNSAKEHGGGMVNVDGSNPALINCAFSGNMAHRGAGMLNRDGSNPTLTNCTFTGNKSGGRGGGIHNLEAKAMCSPVLANCILWENTDEGNVVESAQVYGGTPVVNYCCIQGWTGKLGGTGNIGDDPLFVDPYDSDDEMDTEYDGLRLRPKRK